MEQRGIDWQALRRDYEAGGCSQRELGRRYGVHPSVISRRARREQWAQPDGQQVQRTKLEAVTEQLLQKISQSIEELDVAVLREVEKVRDVEYENPERPDKPTRESTRETERLQQVKSCIDRNGIKLLATALKEIKDTQMLKNPTDLREQEAKIANLLRQSQPEAQEQGVQVVFSAETGECSE